MSVSQGKRASADAVAAAAPTQVRVVELRHVLQLELVAAHGSTDVARLAVVVRRETGAGRAFGHTIALQKVCAEEDLSRGEEEVRKGGRNVREGNSGAVE